MESLTDTRSSPAGIGWPRHGRSASLLVLVGLGVTARVLHLLLAVAGLTTGALSFEDAAGILLMIAGSFVSLAAALVVRRRLPHHPLAGTFVAGVAMLMLHGFTDVAAVIGESALTRPWPALVHTLLEGVIDAAGAVLFVTLLALYPDGTVRRPIEQTLMRLRWWWLLTPLVLLTSSVVPVRWFSGAESPPDNPVLLGPGIELTTANAMRGILQLSAVTAAILLLATRYRRLDLERRRRTRWLALPVIALAFGITASALFREDASTLVFVTFLTVPPMVDVAVAIGLLRQPDAAVDRVVRRSLVYLALWVGVIGSYAGAAAVVGLTAGNRLPLEWAIGLTVVAMLVFNPARVRLQALVDRYVFGQPADPGRLITGLGDSLESGLDLETVLPRMGRAIEEGLGLEWARVRLTTRPATSHAVNDREPVLWVPIEHRGEVVGVVECGPRRHGEITDDDVRLVTTLARQASLAVGNVRLARELAARAEQLAASRTRLVRAQELERRRIERNIHDGVQQDLVGLMALVGSIRARGNGSVPTTDLADVQDGLVRVLEDLRDLAAGIHPSVLTDHGLLTAVEARTQRCPVPVDVTADRQLRTRRFAEEVEGVAYFTVAEAVANSVKHAQASLIGVSLTTTEDVLTITVGDDGTGIGPERGDGQGLWNIEERVDAVGGTFALRSDPDRGTELSVTIPVVRTDQT